MIYSMTAFARRQLEQPWGSLTWEIRSVNHRYLESSIRLPESLRNLEPLAREAIRRKLKRGKVECQLRYQAEGEVVDSLHLNLELIAQLLEAGDRIKDLASDAEPLSVGEILCWPGIIRAKEVEVSTLEKSALELFDTALEDLATTRQREGAELGRLIEQRLEAIGDIIQEIRAILPGILERQRSNIVSRLDDLKLELDPIRLEQELVLMAQKSDVDEELDRLEAHIGEVSRVLKASGQKGRRLDFLMQELNREANTLSSKSVVAETTRSAVELKVLIEQMREQIQNIE